METLIKRYLDIRHHHVYAFLHSPSFDDAAAFLAAKALETADDAGEMVPAPSKGYGEIRQ